MRKIISVLCLCSLVLVWGCSKTCTCTTVKEVFDSNTEDPDNPDNPDNPDQPGSTNTEKLCIPQGWVLQAATVTPAVPMGEGYTTDWYHDYLYECEQDDIIFFKTNHVLIINPGRYIPSEDMDGYTEEKASTWQWNYNETKLTMQIPFFYDLSDNPARTFSPAYEETEVLELSENKLILKYTENTTFAKGTNYTWILTYIPVGQKNMYGTKSVQYLSKSENTVKTKGKCSDLNAETTTVDFDGTRYHEKTECK